MNDIATFIFGILAIGALVVLRIMLVFLFGEFRQWQRRRHPERYSQVPPTARQHVILFAIAAVVSLTAWGGVFYLYETKVHPDVSIFSIHPRPAAN